MDEAEYEDRLGDALEKLLDQGADDLETLASGLNQLGVTSLSGEEWTAPTLAAELKRLSA
jgi:hypothetical protein